MEEKVQEKKDNNFQNIYPEMRCKNNNLAKLACCSPCLNNAFICQNDKCECEKDHKKCKFIDPQTLVKKINQKRQSMPKQILDGCDSLRSIYNQAIDRLSKDRQALTLWEDNYGISQLQYKFLQSIQQHSFEKIKGEVIFQIKQGINQQADYSYFTEQWVSQKWGQIQKSFQQIFNILGRPFEGFNLELNNFFPILPCLETKIYGGNGTYFCNISKAKGLHLTQIYIGAGSFINGILVCFGNQQQQTQKEIRQLTEQKGGWGFNPYSSKYIRSKYDSSEDEQSQKDSKQKIKQQQQQSKKMPAGTWIVPKGQYIQKIKVRSGSWMDGLQFITNAGTQSPSYGGDGGGFHQIQIPKGYRIIGIYGSTGTYLMSFGVILGKHLNNPKDYKYFKYDNLTLHDQVLQRLFIGRSFIPRNL